MSRRFFTTAALLLLLFLAVVAPVIYTGSASTTTVCFGQPWPSGYIRTNYFFSPSCGNPASPQYPNTSSLESYFDKPPGTVMDVCNDNFIPPTWVLTETVWNSTQCGGSPASKNMARIRSVAPTDTTLDICAQTPIPPGWHFVRQYQGTYGCGSLTAPSHLRWVIARDAPRKVHVVYLVPKDRSVRKDYELAVGNAILHLQNFYQSQVSASGYTFVTNSPLVEVYKTTHNTSYYSSSTTDPNDFNNKVLADGFALSGGSLNDPNNRWVYYIDADPGCVIVNNQTVLQSVGGGAGVAVLPANDLRGLTGQPAVGLCGQTADPGGRCRWIGGLGHELGHAFGLPHPPGCDQATGCTGGSQASNSLMYLGYTAYPNTYFLPADISQLLNTGFLTSLKLDGPRFNCNANPIDDQRVFVRAQYLDILGREPDQGGYDGWSGSIYQCSPSDAACINQRRVSTARGFLESLEFKYTILCQGQNNCILLNNPPTSDAYMQEYVRQLYLVYLKRPPDSNGWLDIIRSTGGSDEGYNNLVAGFINSVEYRQRFGP